MKKTPNQPQEKTCACPGADCATRYPLLMLHGIGYQDTEACSYWGSIPALLRARGARVYFGHQSACGSIEENARFLQKRVEAILEHSQKEKVHILAHSKGGLEARFLISSLGMGAKVASLTTFSTPHFGSLSMNWLLRSHPLIMKAVAFLFFFHGKRLGDKHPAPGPFFHQVTPKAMARFNRENPDDPRVLYQSVAASMNRGLSHLRFAFFHRIILGIEGENDGLVAAWSAGWGRTLGVLRARDAKGVSHVQMTGRYRKSLPVFLDETPFDDLSQLYLWLVRDLKEKGL